MTIRNVLFELWEARHALWESEDRRRAADDALWEVIRRPHSEHEYLTGLLEVAHGHMVGRDLTERAVMAVLDSPRPPRRDADDARRAFGKLLHEYGGHREALERLVAIVRERRDETARQARRAGTPAARVQPTATALPARPSGRFLV